MCLMFPHLQNEESWRENRFGREGRGTEGEVCGRRLNRGVQLRRARVACEQF